MRTYDPFDILPAGPLEGAAGPPPWAKGASWSPETLAEFRRHWLEFTSGIGNARPVMLISGAAPSIAYVGSAKHIHELRRLRHWPDACERKRRAKVRKAEKRLVKAERRLERVLMRRAGDDWAGNAAKRSAILRARHRYGTCLDAYER